MKLLRRLDAEETSLPPPLPTHVDIDLPFSLYSASSHITEKKFLLSLLLSDSSRVVEDRPFNTFQYQEGDGFFLFLLIFLLFFGFSFESFFKSSCRTSQYLNFHLVFTSCRVPSKRNSTTKVLLMPF